VANIASQIKRNRQNEKRRLRNKSVRAELRTRTKNAVTAATSGAEDSVEQLRPWRDPQEHRGQPQVPPRAPRRRH
jgi:ribosomal protein S20